MVEAEERRRRRGRVRRVRREPPVGGAVGQDGGWGRQAVDFDADEGEGGPGGEGPWAGVVGLAGLEEWLLFELRDG